MERNETPRKRSTRQADREAMRIAGRQWGAIARSQALKAGMTSHQIAHRLTTGQWRRAARGVYVVAGTPGEALWDLVDSAICRKLVRPSRLVRASNEAWAEARGRRRRDLEKLERALDVRRSGAPAGSPPEARLQRKLIEWGSRGPNGRSRSTTTTGSSSPEPTSGYGS